MKIKSYFKYLMASLIVFLGNASNTFAEIKGTGGIKSQLEGVTRNITDLIDPIVNIVLAIVGVIALGVIMWAYAKKKKGDANANDALMDAGWTTLVVVIFVYVVKLFFF